MLNPVYMLLDGWMFGCCILDLGSWHAGCTDVAPLILDAG